MGYKGLRNFIDQNFPEAFDQLNKRKETEKESFQYLRSFV